MLAARIVALVAAVLVMVGAGVGWAVTGTVQSNSGTSDAAANAGSSGVTFRGGMTILLVGSDARTDANGNPLSADELAQLSTQHDGGGVNTDTIMLVHIPEGGGKATAVSLPRDTWIGPTVMNQVVGPYADGTDGTYSPTRSTLSIRRRRRMPRNGWSIGASATGRGSSVTPTRPAAPC